MPEKANRYTNMKCLPANTTIIPLLCLSVLLLFAPGCASKRPQGPDQRAHERIDELKNLVEAEVRDPERAEAMVAVLERARTEVRRQAEVMEAQLEGIRGGSREYETSRAELETTLADLDADTLRILDVLQDAHFEMKQLATEEEWATVVNQERKFLGVF